MTRRTRSQVYLSYSADVQAYNDHPVADTVSCFKDNQIRKHAQRQLLSQDDARPRNVCSVGFDAALSLKIDLSHWPKGLAKVPIAVDTAEHDFLGHFSIFKIEISFLSLASDFVTK